jgi:hypothetical protein
VDDWSLGGTGEYDYFLWGEQKSHFSDAGLMTRKIVKKEDLV